MKFSDSVLAKPKKGKVEVRTIDSRGEYVVCKYLDPETLKPTSKKRKLSLKDDKGNITEYFIVPLKTPNRSLLIAAEKEKKIGKVWNEKNKKEENYWNK